MNFLERPNQTFSRIRFLDNYMDSHNGFIAGGCFKNIFLKQRIKDIDIFFENEKDFVEAELHFRENKDYVFSYENPKTVAFKNTKTNIRIELVRQTYGTPIEILTIFDFSITRFAYAKRQKEDSFEYYSVFVESFFEDMTNNKLVIDGDLRFPVSSFERAMRYRGYGFGLCKESKAKLLEALKTADTNDLSNDLYFGID